MIVNSNTYRIAHPIMKHLYYIIFLSILFCCDLNGQSGLLGTWYLDHIIKDGVTHPNYFNDHTIFDIEFTNNLGDLPNTLSFTSGHGCNASNGSYATNSNEITIYISGTTLADCLTRPHAIYELLYLNELSYDNFNGSIHTYSITDMDNEDVLTLTNPNNSNTLVYKKQPPTTLLVDTWWLHQIDIPGNPIIDIPSSDFPNIIFSNAIVDPMINFPEANGVGECEGFYATYHITFNGANYLSIGNFVQTLSACATQAYEGIYFGILGNDATNFFEFEIINNGETLVLTDLLGARLIFGSVPLSIDDQIIVSPTVALKQNPVDHQIDLLYDQSILSKDINYRIYSIDGKQMVSANLNQKSIDISNADAGIYFISFSENNTVISTLKFIKK
ncbi:MAG: T9SS type A sorting domain-containing protein [Bacteroidota bacterium]